MFVSSYSRRGKEQEPGERSGWRGQQDKGGEGETCALNEGWKRGGGRVKDTEARLERRVRGHRY